MEEIKKSLFSSILSVNILYPIFCVKNISQKNLYETGKYSIRNIITDTYKKGGIRKFYNGIQCHNMTYPLFWTIFFGIKQDKKSVVANCAAANIASLIVNPMFVVATQKNVNGGTYLQTINNIYTKGKLQGFYKGYMYTCFNNNKLVLQFPLYDYAKLKTENVMFSAFIAKFISDLIFYPTDYYRLLKRINVEKDFVINLSFRNMYKGSFIYMLHSVPNFALMMTFKEWL